MRNFLIIGTILIVFGLTKETSASLNSQKNFIPENDHSYSLRRIQDLMEEHHYNGAIVLDDQDSEKLLELWIKKNDRLQIYLNETDIQSLYPVKYKLDNYFIDRDIDKLFKIYNFFISKQKEFLNYCKERAQKPFNLNKDENFNFIYQRAQTPRDDQELSHRRDRYLKSIYINSILAGMENKDALKTVANSCSLLNQSIARKSSTEVFEEIVNLYIGYIDSHSYYTRPTGDLAAKNKRNGQSVGIGIDLKLNANGHVEVTKVYKNSPAFYANTINVGDIIMAISKVGNSKYIKLENLLFSEIVDLISGSKKSKIGLKIIKAGDFSLPAKKIVLTRDSYELTDYQVSFSIYETTDTKLGVIKIPTFGYFTRLEVLQTLNYLKKQNIDVLALDLRGNGGGSLMAATGIARQFIDDTRFLITKNNMGKTQVIESQKDANKVYDGPLIVLVDRYSASASEILAGALQDYKRAIIFGEPTYGKGTVQTAKDILSKGYGKTNHGKLYVTTKKYFRVTGQTTQKRGITPDVLIPSEIDFKTWGTRGQNSVLSIESVNGIDRSKQYISNSEFDKIIGNHRQRVEMDENYQSELLAIPHRKRKSEVTLNLNTRITAQEEIYERDLENYNRVLKSLGLEQLESTQQFLKMKANDSRHKAIIDYDPFLNELVELASDMKSILAGSK
ncbi:MAG: carboxy terminal-processing peptidase [Bdellovibrionales bacterium]